MRKISEGPGGQDGVDAEMLLHVLMAGAILWPLHARSEFEDAGAARRATQRLTRELKRLLLYGRASPERVARARGFARTRRPRERAPQEEGSVTAIAYDPFSEAQRANPYPQYAELRRRTPVYRVERLGQLRRLALQRRAPRAAPSGALLLQRDAAADPLGLRPRRRNAREWASPAPTPLVWSS